MRYGVAIAAMASLIIGCKQQSDQPNETKAGGAPSVEATTQEKPRFSKDEWRAAFKKSAEFSEEKPTEDGTKEYTACFYRVDAKNCPAFAFGIHDAFKKVDILSPSNSQLKSIANAFTTIKIRVVALECKNPQIVVNPFLNQREWVFMHQVAIMVDGAVVLQHSFDKSGVKRETSGNRVYESASFVPNDEEIEGLRRVASATMPIIIRVTGDRGYLTLPKDETKAIKEAISEALLIHEKLTQHLADAGGPICD